jgi:glycosyltransferase involved in cell wall biosynthesis
MNKKVMFLPLYNDDWASSKYRVYRHIGYLEKYGLQCIVIKPSEPTFFSRLQYYFDILWNIPRVDIIYIHKKIFRSIPFNFFLLTGKTMVFDFDDAIYCYDKDRNDINYILTNVHQVVVADECLAVYARQYNKRVEIIPTPLESTHKTIDDRAIGDILKIAWIGRPGNHHYLSTIAEVFKQLKEYPRKIELYVVSGEPFQFKNADLPVINVPWSEVAEEEVLHSIDIGIVPLTDDEWSRGKCPYKVLLYMSHGIPVIASPVGAKATLIKNGINGLLASSHEQWIDSIRLLCEDRTLRRKIGTAGYETFLKDYSYEVVSARLATLLKSIQN